MGIPLSSCPARSDIDEAIALGIVAVADNQPNSADNGLLREMTLLVSNPGGPDQNALPLLRAPRRRSALAVVKPARRAAELADALASLPAESRSSYAMRSVPTNPFEAVGLAVLQRCADPEAAAVDDRTPARPALGRACRPGRGPRRSGNVDASSTRQSRCNLT